MTAEPASAARQSGAVPRSRRPLVVEVNPDAVELLTMEVATHLSEVAPRVVRSMHQAIEEAVDDLADSELQGMLHASVEGNISTILHMLVNQIPLEHVSVPPAALGYAVRLARADIPAASLRRAYHIGSDDLRAHCFAAIEALDVEAEVKLPLLHHVSGWLHRYVDWVTRQVLEAHEQERLAMHSQSATHISQMVHRVVEREPIDHEHFARATGHRLDQHHRALVMWLEGGSQGIDQIDRLRDLATPLAHALGVRQSPLFTPLDRSTAWVWFGHGDVLDPPRADVTHLARVLAPTPGIRAAVGSVEQGVSGFRRSLDQANAVRLVAGAASRGGRQVAAYDEDGIAAVAMLARDVASLRRWVSEVLGPLADDSEAASTLRDTVRAFLRTGSYTDTSEELSLHRNTVKYRITKVERERGRPLLDGRLDLELALHVCHVLGAEVLRTPLGRRPY